MRTESAAGDLAAVVAAASVLLRSDIAVVRLLTGGEHATTLLVTDGTSQYVVRAFPPADQAVEREAEILGRLGSLGSFVPRLIAYDEDPEGPIIVTSVVHGTTPAPSLPLRTVASQMAWALARIHQLDGTGLRFAPIQAPSGDSEIAARAREGWDDLDMSEPVLTHYDFWCGNALWDGDRLTGIVDWSGARNAPRGVDVAWCRLDLVLLGAPETAEYFLTEYERHTGRAVCHVTRWDLQAATQAYPVVESWAPNYHGIGRTSPTAEVLRRRLNAWIATL